MTTKASEPRKKLIEHSIPLEAINKASAREKSVRHGHPSTMHLWWARRPLAACRAVLFAQLVDDPSAWPDKFRTEEERDKERRRLHDVIAAMVEWPKSTAADQKRFERAIEAARWEIARSVAWGQGKQPPPANDPKKVLDYLQTEAPPVYDPFCGGGSIPLEAQRLGLRAYGSDLNPVAVLITKALIEFPPKFAGSPPIYPTALQDQSLLGRAWTGAQGLAEDVRRYGQWMREQAEKRIGKLYPTAKLADGREAVVIAWLWARTVASPDPAQKGAHVPLVSSFVLSSKPGKEAIVVPVRDSSAKDGWRFEVKKGALTSKELLLAKLGTKSAKGQAFLCALSNAPIERGYVQTQGKAQLLGTRLMAIVAEGTRGREYLSPDDAHEAIAVSAAKQLDSSGNSIASSARTAFLSGSTPTRAMITGGVCSAYGLSTWGHLFTDRQLVALTTLSDLVEEVRQRVVIDATANSDWQRAARSGRVPSESAVTATTYADAIATLLAFAVSKSVDRGSTICCWDSSPKMEALRNTFARQALPMTWDFAEGSPFSTSSGNWSNSVEWVANVVAALPAAGLALASQIDAPKNNYPVKPAVISTDPPYYDNIGYADLSDFFYVWLRRTLKDVHPDLFRRLLAPKAEELVATSHRHGGKKEAEAYFMAGMSGALTAMKNASADAPLAVYYAFKQSEVSAEGLLSPGWAAFLQAVVDAGLQIDGTWPVRTELANRMIASGTNALAASVVLVCRKRAVDAPSIGRRDFLRELKPVMAQAIVDHQNAGIPLPDRRQAAIGPGIGVFSKYSLVREADDKAMRVSTALALINKEIDSYLGAGTQDTDAETRFALQWFEQHGYKQLDAGAGAAIAQLQGFNLSEARMNASGVFRAKGGNAKLLTREEMHEAALAKYRSPWRPLVDDNLTVWELAQHMARALIAADGGVDASGRLLAEARVHASDVQLVAERMFELATSKSLNEEARVWSQLQGSWAEIESAADRAAEEGFGAPSEQADMFESE